MQIYSLTNISLFDTQYTKQLNEGTLIVTGSMSNTPHARSYCIMDAPYSLLSFSMLDPLNDTKLLKLKKGTFSN